MDQVVLGRTGIRPWPGLDWYVSLVFQFSLEPPWFADDHHGNSWHSNC